MKTQFANIDLPLTGHHVCSSHPHTVTEAAALNKSAQKQFGDCLLEMARDLVNFRRGEEPWEAYLRSVEGR